MFKKVIFCLLLLLIVIPSIAYASDNSLVKIGDAYYDTLEEAIKNAKSDEVIMLISDVELETSLTIDKTVNINLNGNDIKAPTKVFIVQGGILNLEGKGIIKELKPDYGAIMVIGSPDDTNDSYSTLNIGKDVTLEGWAGIFISHNNKKSYGVIVNFAGNIKAVSDTTGGEGVGIYVNGNIKDETNRPFINILDGSSIISNGNGLYIAGTSTFNIKNAYIEGTEAAIGIKAGTLNIDGGTIVSNGDDKTPTEGYNNGIKASGTALQIESNSSYAGNINISIKDGTLTSKNSYVIYEYIGKGTDTRVNSLNIKKGTFKSEASFDVINLSDSLLYKNSSFIEGGEYSSNPNNYLKSGYTSVLDNDMYKVISSTMKEVSDVESSNGSSKMLIWFIVLFISIMLIVVLITRKKIIKLFVK